MNGPEIYAVKLTRPEGVSVAEMESYIETAVCGWAGSLDPENPLFDLEGEISALKLRLPP